MTYLQWLGQLNPTMYYSGVHVYSRLIECVYLANLLNCHCSKCSASNGLCLNSIQLLPAPFRSFTAPHFSSSFMKKSAEPMSLSQITICVIPLLLSPLPYYSTLIKLWAKQVNKYLKCHCNPNKKCIFISHLILACCEKEDFHLYCVFTG